MAVGVECAARGRLFEQADSGPLGLFGAAQAADGCSSFSEALVRHLERNGWAPQALELGAASSGVARYQEEPQAVSSREMGMFTEAAPSSVRVGELYTALRCTRAAGGGGRDEELTLELEGPGEAVLLSCFVDVSLQVAAATWEQRAVGAAELPEVQPGTTQENLAGAIAAARARWRSRR